MGILLEGKPVVESLREDLKRRIEMLKRQSINPTILIHRVGEREDDISYEKGIIKNCERIGLSCRRDVLPAEITTAELIKKIEHANRDAAMHGIMLFRPLPEHLDEELICRTILPGKDIDCMNPANLEKVFEGTAGAFAPCTPEAVMAMLDYYKVPLEGASVAVVGRSTVVGKPLAMLLLKQNATVTICHSRTKDLAKVTASADVVIAAAGRARFMDDSFFTGESIVIDVGINDGGDGKICGDVDFEKTIDKVKAINPAVGGVGLITTTILLGHTVTSCENQGEYWNREVI